MSGQTAVPGAQIQQLKGAKSTAAHATGGRRERPWKRAGIHAILIVATVRNGACEPCQKIQ